MTIRCRLRRDAEETRVGGRHGDEDDEADGAFDDRRLGPCVIRSLPLSPTLSCEDRMPAKPGAIRNPLPLPPPPTTNAAAPQPTATATAWIRSSSTSAPTPDPPTSSLETLSIPPNRTSASSLRSCSRSLSSFATHSSSLAVSQSSGGGSTRS